MSPSAAFQLESLSYQTDAVESVVRVFEGTSKPSAADLAGNRCSLTWAQISANLEAIAQHHRINGERLNLMAPTQGQPLDVCVEMETGTGKTLTQLSADNGIDGFINEDPLGLDTIYLQAKRWQDPVGEGPVRDFIGALVIEHNLGVSVAQSFALKRLDMDFFGEE